VARIATMARPLFGGWMKWVNISGIAVILAILLAYAALQLAPLLKSSSQSLEPAPATDVTEPANTYAETYAPDTILDPAVVEPATWPSYPAELVGTWAIVTAKGERLDSLMVLSAEGEFGGTDRYAGTWYSPQEGTIHATISGADTKYTYTLAHEGGETFLMLWDAQPTQNPRLQPWARNHVKIADEPKFLAAPSQGQ